MPKRAYVIFSGLNLHRGQETAISGQVSYQVSSALKFLKIRPL